MPDRATLPNTCDNSVIDPLLLNLDNRASGLPNEPSVEFNSNYLSGDMAIEYGSGALSVGSSGLYQQTQSPASHLTPYRIPISPAAATQVNVSIDSSRNELNAGRASPESQQYTDSDDNVPRTPIKRARRAWAGGQTNRFESKARLTVGDPEALKIFEHLAGNASLHGHIMDILTSPWYYGGKDEPLRPTSPNNHTSKRRATEANNSVFRPLFSPTAPYQCLICNNGAVGRSLERALGHARGHFGVKIDEKYTNNNTRKDQDRRKKEPRIQCIDCGKEVTKQNLSRHKLKKHGLKATSRLSKTTN